MTKRPPTSPFGVPTSTAQPELTAKTRRAKTTTLDAIIASGWKPVVQLGLLLGFALAFFVLGSEPITHILIGGAIGNALPAWSSRRK